MYNSLRELNALYKSGKLPTLRYIRRLEAKLSRIERAAEEPCNAVELIKQR